MKKICCEKCGKELNFFDRKGSLNNDRLGIHYDKLCGKCAQTLKAGIQTLDDIYNDMINTLKDSYHISNMAAVDLDLLIFLAVEAIFRLAPNYSQLDSPLNLSLINRDERRAPSEEDLIIVVEHIIDYGFAINKKNAQIIDFTGYFKRTTLYSERVGLNSREDVPKIYYNMLFTGRGLAAIQIDTGEILSLPMEENEEIQYRVIDDNQIFVESMAYPTHPEKQLILYPEKKDQLKEITQNFDQINVVARRRKEYKHRDIMKLITAGIMRDLSRIQPDGQFISLPIDCILIFTVKNIMSDPDGRRSELYAPDGLAMDILFESFYDNLTAFGRTNRDDMAEYMQKNTLLSEGFFVQHENKKEKAWAFFTTKGYILCMTKSRKFVYVFENTFPNDIYYPCNDLIYKGCRFLQLAENHPETDASGDYRKFDGLIFFSDDIDLIGKMNRFFNLNNIFYVMDRYIEAESRVMTDRESMLELKRISDKLFGEFSFLPFCQYDEWAAICEKMREDDFLLCQLIDQKNGGKNRSPYTPTTYTVRIMKSFNRCAKELEQSLHFGDLSVAKAVLWGYFNNALIDTLAKEWVRVAGDFIYPGESLERAFAKYLNATEIENDKSYYMGLFIYYLMSKDILKSDDFLENYERCVAVYRQFNKHIEDEKITETVPETTKESEKVMTPQKQETVDKDNVSDAPVSQDVPDTEKDDGNSGITVEKDNVSDAPASQDVPDTEKDINNSEKKDIDEEDQETAVETDSETESVAKETSAEDTEEPIEPEESKDSDTAEQISMLSGEICNLKNPSEILAEKAAAEAGVEQPIRRVIEENESEA